MALLPRAAALRTLVATVLAASAGVGIAPTASAAVSNDAAASAAVLSSGVAFTGSTAGATSGGEPATTLGTGACQRMSSTVWFRVQGNGHTLAFTTAGSSIDTVLAVYATAAAPGRPNDSDRVACSDDISGTNSASAITLTNTIRGRTYLVQVGDGGSRLRRGQPRLCLQGGAIKLAMTASPVPANDARASALPISTGTPATANNTGATSQAGEVLTCSGAAYAATVWFSWTAPSAGTPTFDASATFTGAARPADTVVAVYKDADAAALACNDDASAGGDGRSRVTLPSVVEQGERFLIQVGARGLEAPSLGEGLITVQVSLAALPLPAPTITGADGDGFGPGVDCDDGNPQIHNGAFDVPDNGINEDCSPDGDAINLDRDGDGFRARPTATTRAQASGRARSTCPAIASTRTAAAAMRRSRCSTSAWSGSRRPARGARSSPSCR